MKLISLVCKKLQKGLNAEQIAEVLEEELTQIQEICLAVEVCATYEDCDKIYAQWKNQNS